MKNTRLFAFCIAVSALCAEHATAQNAGSSAAQQTVGAPVLDNPAPGALWTLDDCIAYALNNNIEIQRQVLQVEQGEVELTTARYSRLPNLSASVGGNFSNSRADYNDPNAAPGEVAPIYGRKNTLSGSFNASANMPLFQGFRINKQIKGSKLDLAAAMQDLERIRENVSVNIMTFYLQVLFSKELVAIAENQLVLSTEQVERSRNLVDAGKQPQSTLYESEALQASDMASLTQARNDLQTALLNLSQALNRESAAGFDVVVPAFDELTLASLHLHGSIGEVYDYAAENRPHLRAERLRVQSAENAVKIARSAFYPSISLSAGIGTSARDTSDEEFWTQIQRNNSPSVGISMGIPIFNRMATRGNVNSAKIAARNRALTLTETELALRKEIEQAWYSADAAYNKYRSAQTALASARVAFAYAQEKADAGRSPIFDFNEARTRMQKAEGELAQSKYEFVFRSKILDFYRGLPLRL